MIDYLKLGRNLYRFAPRVKAKTTTFVYNNKGIEQFKQKSPELMEELNNSFRGVDKPVLELSFRTSKHDIGEIVIKDGNEELSKDNFVLIQNQQVTQFLPQTDGYMKKIEFDKDGIMKIAQQNEQLKKVIPDFVAGLIKPKLELIISNRKNFSICKITLKEGDKVIEQGFYSRTHKSKTLNEKIHFKNERESTIGFGDVKNSFIRQFKRLDKKLLRRLWLLDTRTKEMVKAKYGIGCSPKETGTIADYWGLTGSRIRGLIREAKKKMYEANTYCPELREDLDNLDYVLDDKERYKLYHKRDFQVGIEEAKEKIREYWRNIL